MAYSRLVGCAARAELDRLGWADRAGGWAGAVGWTGCALRPKTVYHFARKQRSGTGAGPILALAVFRAELAPVAQRLVQDSETSV